MGSFLRLVLASVMLAASSFSLSQAPAMAQTPEEICEQGAPIGESIADGTVTVIHSGAFGNDYVSATSLAGYRDCSWFAETVCPRMETSVRNLVELNPGSWAPGSSNLDLYRACSWHAELSAPATATAGFDASSNELLPIYRWNVNTLRRFDEKGVDVANSLQALGTTFLGTIAFGLSSMAWSLVRGVMAATTSMSEGLFNAVAPVVNDVFADIGRTIQGFLTVALVVVLFSLVRAFLAGRKKTEAVRNVIILVIFSGIFYSISVGSQAAVDNNRPDLSVGTAAWVGSTAVNLGTRLTDPLTQRLAGGERLEIAGVEDAFGGAEVTDSSCSAYAGLLHAEAANSGSPGPMRMLSTLWESTYLASFERAQFGESGPNDLPGHAICHFADDQNGVSRSERFRFVSQLSPGSYSASSPFFADHDERGQLGEAVTAAAACRVVDGRWTVLPDYRGLIEDGNCAAVFLSDDSTINGASNNSSGVALGKDRFKIYGGAQFGGGAYGVPEELGDEAKDFARRISISLSDLLPPFVAGLASLVGAVGVLAAFGAMALAMMFSSALALVSVGFLLPLLLVLLAAQSKKSKAVGRLAASLLAVNIFVQLLMFAIMSLSILIQSVVTATFGSIPLISDFLLGGAPILALFIVSKLLRAAGFGGINGMRFSDLAMLPMNMGMRMSGVKSLQDLSRVDSQNRNAFHRFAESFGSPEGRLKRLADKDRDATATSEFFERMEGKKDGMAGRINRLTSNTESHRRWTAERDNRKELEEATRLAKANGMEVPRNIAEARQVRGEVERKKAEDMSDALYNEYLLRRDNGDLERWENSTEDTPEAEANRAKAKALREAGLVGAGYIPDSQDIRRVRADFTRVFGEAASPSERASQTVEQFGPLTLESLGSPRAAADPDAYDNLAPGELEQVPLSARRLASLGTTSMSPEKVLAANEALANSEYRGELQRTLEADGFAALSQVDDPQMRADIQSRARAAANQRVLERVCRSATEGYAVDGLNGSARASIVAEASAASGVPAEKLTVTRDGVMFVNGDSGVTYSLIAGDSADDVASEILSLPPEEAAYAVASLENFILSPSERALTGEAKQQALVASAAAYGLLDISTGSVVNIKEHFSIDPANPKDGLEALQQHLSDAAGSAAVRKSAVLAALEERGQGYETVAPNVMTVEQVDFCVESVRPAVDSGLLVEEPGGSYALNEVHVRGTVSRLAESTRNAATGDPKQVKAEVQRMAQEAERALQMLSAAAAVEVAGQTITPDGFAPREYAEEVRKEVMSRLQAVGEQVACLQSIAASGNLNPSSKYARQEDFKRSADEAVAAAREIMSQVDQVDLFSVAFAAEKVAKRAEDFRQVGSRAMNVRQTQARAWV